MLPNGEVLEDHKNYRNINALKKDEKAYDVLTIWATDRLISGEEPQAVIDRRVVKTVVAEVTGVNDAPEVISKTPDVLFTEGGAAVDIAIDPANFFDVDGDELIITVTLDDGSALSLLELTYDDPITPGRIIGTPKTAGTHIIKGHRHRPPPAERLAIVSICQILAQMLKRARLWKSLARQTRFLRESRLHLGPILALISPIWTPMTPTLRMTR